MPTRRQGNWLGAGIAAAAVAFAFYAQYGLGLVPCHLCIFQRFTLAASISASVYMATGRATAPAAPSGK